MNPTTGLELWSDLIGFLSALVILLPTLRAEKFLKFVAEFRWSVDDAERKGAEDPNVPKFLKWLENEPGTWSGFDAVCLRVGAALLVLSFGLKIVYHGATRAWFGGLLAPLI
jgi:hypothetical protein